MALTPRETPSWAMPVLQVLVGAIIGWFASTLNLSGRLEAIESNDRAQDIKLERVVTTLEKLTVTLDRMITEKDK